jgi:hypothetical protein
VKPLLHSDSDAHKFSCLTIENLCRDFEFFAPFTVIRHGFSLKRFSHDCKKRLVAGSLGQKSLPRSGAAG